MSRPDPSARASRKLTSHRLLGQRRTVEVRGAPLMRKSRVKLQGHVGLPSHLYELYTCPCGLMDKAPPS